MAVAQWAPLTLPSSTSAWEKVYSQTKTSIVPSTSIIAGSISPRLKSSDRSSFHVVQLNNTFSISDSLILPTARVPYSLGMGLRTSTFHSEVHLL
ncbi:hypothetical protein TNCT_387841 [Trichonephila clavata]|uniref:Uncharacterized protein n=1 Tax=Trichonephila clavata TaxID=2740835 RepID=A0A8X6LL78_TRICU|nr:hypothetical protein TNCT_387841 [Trichonephila clavata]